MFKIIENKAKGQYLVAALLPDSVLDKPMELSKRLLKGCPTGGPDIDGKLIECSTSAVILNKESEEIWRRSPWANEIQYRNHPWHGEYRLVNDGIIERLIGNFHNENGNGANCRVYLYSFYIPCADILGCPYSCSDQVAAYNNRGDTTCKITVIGYTEVFRRSKTIKTNEVRAENVLKAEMDLHHTVSAVKLLAIKTVREQNMQLTFQELMYSCLFESPLSGCCVDDTDSRSNSKKVISYFVNNMVHKAVNIPKFANKRFSEASRKALAEYFLEWVKTQIHTDCGKCPYDRYNAFLIGFCSKTALDLASGFGRPASENDLSSPNWNIYTGSWTNLYTITPEQYRKSFMCAFRSLSVDSLCTRLTVTTIKLPTLERERSRSPLNSRQLERG